MASLGRREKVKKPVDPSESRRRREDESLSVRKARKDELLKKRRNFVAGGLMDMAEASSEEVALTAGSIGHVASVHTMGDAQFGPALTSSLLLPSLVTPPETTLSISDYLAALLAAPDVGAALAAANRLRALVSRKDDDGSAVAAIAADGAGVARLVELLAHEACPELQLEAAWIVTNVCASEWTRVAVAAGAVPRLVRLLASSSPKLVEQAVWSLGNPVCQIHPLRRLSFSSCFSMQVILLETVPTSAFS